MGFPGWKTACDWLDENLKAPEPSLSAAKGQVLRIRRSRSLKITKICRGRSFGTAFREKICQRERKRKC